MGGGPTYEQVEVGGRRWTIAAGAREALSPVLGRIDDPALGAVVKENPARTVVRLEVPGLGGAYLKRFRIRGAVERAKHLVVATKARAEWRTLVRLRGALGEATGGAEVAEPLAFAEERSLGVPVRSWLLVREVPNGGTLLRALAALPARAGPRDEEWERRHGLLDAAGRIIRRLHDAGLWHRDLHPQNFLVTAEGLAAIDLHKGIFLPRLPGFLRVQDLGVFAAQIRPVTSLTERMAFLRAYAADRRRARRLLPGVERAAARWLAGHRASRERRAWLPRTSEFRRERHGPDLVRRRVAADQADVIQVVDEVSRGAGEVLKRDGRATVAKLSGPGGGAVVVKAYAPVPVWRRLADLFRPPPGVRAWGAAHAVSYRPVPVATPLALVERRVGPSGVRRFLVAPFVDGAPLVDAYRTADPAGRAALARAVARLFRDLHEGAIDHRDLKASNLIVAAEGAAASLFRHPADRLPGAPVVTPLDFDAACVRDPSWERRVRNAGHLLASLEAAGVRVGRTDLARFLGTYVGTQGTGPLGRDRAAERATKRAFAHAVLADRAGHHRRWGTVNPPPLATGPRRREAIVQGSLTRRLAGEPTGASLAEASGVTEGSLAAALSRGERASELARRHPLPGGEGMRGATLLLLSAAVLAALLLRGVAAARSSVVSPDGALFARLAEAASAGRWDEVFGAAQHPLVPLAGGGLARFVAPEAALRALSVALGGLATVAAFLLARAAAARVWPRREAGLSPPRVAGLIAAWLHAVHPSLVRYGAEPTADAPAAALFLASVASVACAASAAGGARRAGAPSPGRFAPDLSRRERWELAAAGGLAGLAYLARPEGALAVLAGLWVVAAAARLGSGRTLARAAALGVPFAALVLPFVIHLHAETGSWWPTTKKAPEVLLGWSGESEAPGPGATPAADEGGAHRPGPVGAIPEVLRVFSRAATEPLIILAALGVFWAGRRAAPILAVLIPFVALAALQRGNVGYLSPRHMLPAAAIAIPLAALALRRAGDLVAGARSRRGAAAVAVLLLAAWTAVYLPRGVLDPYAGKAPAILDAAALVRASTPAGRPALVVGAGWGAGPVARAAGAAWVEAGGDTLADLAAAAALVPAATHVVLYERAHGAPLAPLSAAPPGWVLAGEATSASDGGDPRSYRLAVYRIEFAADTR